MKIKVRKTAGFSLVEIIIYTAILAAASAVVVSTLLALTSSFENVKSGKSIAGSANVALERITREIRNSKSADLAVSQFNVNPGVLKLNAVDQSGDEYTIKFYIDGGVVMVEKNSESAVALTSSQTVANDLTFRRVITSVGEAIRVELALESDSNGQLKSEKFYAAAVMRGSY
ncbi:MAG: hypothetical protein A3G52_02795 [Candidatus Taylorbacteria bacterium RIFCSPLOWO2_12_FULL_43_20]|uniref:Prepilin-type N-terminal cleavage/methylation domain-containing protein n=1 Tax=Candidatus Taylorbacteria bacterium RIFCSPLOWO2_12_FULL_43_20 TaxID=1802332 RepID=A0A1G2NZT0_9BACT|nr:MAG: hypothetical protein A2825_02975 [Candidatus Taylorbacteria bacterium RIFCSPHIGHO2_01_FULL_43_120]OHA23652.1 MAG: hypothetical protein A3B98_03290 [Candidatus Taylorbacteria bacterium RIFCSPHIGHO2_02_FULL_43_55]OHA28127.1 MAG: hypothetical protein A3E92_00280 [Candidatus Taylorbacteria bacterium RIFCSPHIGHO2_12_FULL_42_34]OHA32340.1 MAG: hypothetical protein A3B09_03200 [Candidatus Taylorbacteria bacterium RIFCSPLOWO2_01_FULL_43_83]OHA37677.1 MAG: hypothetical protein A3H58_03320 [Candi